MTKKFFHGILISFTFAVICFLACATTGAKSGDSLLFPKESFTVETKTVDTPAGKKQITYHSYKHIPYVANPIDTDFQSLDVSVPVNIDGVAVDATNAPILFSINVAGYNSANNATGFKMAPPPPGMGPPPGGPGGPGGPPPGGPPGQASKDLSLASGFVIVEPGCRGRDNKAPDGTYYGKAPIAIVDLKAAVRYLRHNDDVMPGNAEWIISHGGSAGGALSALLGASGNSSMYDSYLKEIGAADEDDNIFASACYCPITDLEHADMQYEWNYGSYPTREGLVDQNLSKQLRDAFAEYQASLKLKGKDGFGMITADNYSDYLMQAYLIPSANKFLGDLPAGKRSEYLAKNKWLRWTGDRAEFTFADYVKHAGRMKGLPAFDDFEMKEAEPIEFGNKTTDARHFTEFSLRHTSGDMNARIDSDFQRIINMMNPMYFIGENNRDCVKYWWIRHGTRDNHTSQTVPINLATSLENRGKEVNTWLYWDGFHGADEDPEAFIAWIEEITGYTGR